MLIYQMVNHVIFSPAKSAKLPEANYKDHPLQLSPKIRRQSDPIFSEKNPMSRNEMPFKQH